MGDFSGDAAVGDQDVLGVFSFPIFHTPGTGMRLATALSESQVHEKFSVLSAEKNTWCPFPGIPFMKYSSLMFISASRGLPEYAGGY